MDCAMDECGRAVDYECIAERLIRRESEMIMGRLGSESISTLVLILGAGHGDRCR